MHPDIAQNIPKKGYGYVYHIKAAKRDYIGISTTPWSVRWSHHKSPSSGCHKLANWLQYCRQKNLWDSIEVQFIQAAKSQKLDQLQKKYIKKYASYNTLSGLNSTPGGRDCYPRYKTNKRKSKKKVKLNRKVIIDLTWQLV